MAVEGRYFLDNINISSHGETKVENAVPSRHWLTLVNKPSKFGIKLGQKSVITYEVVASNDYVFWKSRNITQTTVIEFICIQVRKSTIYAFQ